MAIDVQNETLFSFHDAGKNGIRRCTNTLKAWAKNGKVSLVTGCRVKLESVFDGTAICTSKEAYYRFLFRLNGQDIPPHLRGLDDGAADNREVTNV